MTPLRAPLALLMTAGLLAAPVHAGAAAAEQPRVRLGTPPVGDPWSARVLPWLLEQGGPSWFPRQEFDPLPVLPGDELGPPTELPDWESLCDFKETERQQRTYWSATSIANARCAAALRKAVEEDPNPGGVAPELRADVLGSRPVVARAVEPIREVGQQIAEAQVDRLDEVLNLEGIQPALARRVAEGLRDAYISEATWRVIGPDPTQALPPLRDARALEDKYDLDPARGWAPAFAWAGLVAAWIERPEFVSDADVEQAAAALEAAREAAPPEELQPWLEWLALHVEAARDEPRAGVVVLLGGLEPDEVATGTPPRYSLVLSMSDDDVLGAMALGQAIALLCDIERPDLVLPMLHRIQRRGEMTEAWFDTLVHRAEVFSTRPGLDSTFLLQGLVDDGFPPQVVVPSDDDRAPRWRAPPAARAPPWGFAGGARGNPEGRHPVGTAALISLDADVEPRCDVAAMISPNCSYDDGGEPAEGDYCARFEAALRADGTDGPGPSKELHLYLTEMAGVFDLDRRGDRRKERSPWDWADPKRDCVIVVPHLPESLDTADRDLLRDVGTAAVRGAPRKSSVYSSSGVTKAFWEGMREAREDEDLEVQPLRWPVPALGATLRAALVRELIDDANWAQAEARLEQVFTLHGHGKDWDTVGGDPTSLDTDVVLALWVSMLTWQRELAVAGWAVDDPARGLARSLVEGPWGEALSGHRRWVRTWLIGFRELTWAGDPLVVEYVHDAPRRDPEVEGVPTVLGWHVQVLTRIKPLLDREVARAVEGRPGASLDRMGPAIRMEADFVEQLLALLPQTPGEVELLLRHFDRETPAGVDVQVSDLVRTSLAHLEAIGAGEQAARILVAAMDHPSVHMLGPAGTVRPEEIRALLAGVLGLHPRPKWRSLSVQLVASLRRLVGQADDSSMQEFDSVTSGQLERVAWAESAMSPAVWTDAQSRLRRLGLQVPAARLGAASQRTWSQTTLAVGSSWVDLLDPTFGGSGPAQPAQLARDLVMRACRADADSQLAEEFCSERAGAPGMVLGLVIAARRVQEPLASAADYYEVAAAEQQAEERVAQADALCVSRTARNPDRRPGREEIAARVEAALARTDAWRLDPGRTDNLALAADAWDDLACSVSFSDPDANGRWTVGLPPLHELAPRAPARPSARAGCWRPCGGAR